jgi:hypothetical protein
MIGGPRVAFGKLRQPWAGGLNAVGVRKKMNFGHYPAIAAHKLPYFCTAWQVAASHARFANLTMEHR